MGEDQDPCQCPADPPDLERRNRLAEHDDTEKNRDHDVQIGEGHHQRDRQVVESKAVEERAHTGEDTDAEACEH
jgi:hypothetical protein